MSFKKRGAVYSVVALMLCVAVYLNWSYNKGDKNAEEVTSLEAGLLHGLSDTEHSEEQPVSQTTDTAYGFFASARLSRDKARDEALGILNATLENESATQQARDEAAAAIQVMAQGALQESRIEGLITAKGYAQCVVYVNTNGINVIISKTENGLTDADAARIKEIVIEETGVTADKIKIIENT